MIIEILFAFIGTMGFAVIFSVEKKHLLHCGITGAIGWAIYLLTLHTFDSTYIATLFSAFTLTIVSRYLSIREKTPATVFLVTGIFTLVPGAGMYYTAYYLFMNQPDVGASRFMDTIKIALQIALGIVAGYVLPADPGAWIKAKIQKKA